MNQRPVKDEVISVRWLPGRLLLVVVGLLGLLATAYMTYLWVRYFRVADMAGLPGQKEGSDFRAFSVAGSLARVGNVTDLYNPLSDAYVDADAAAFVYPPWYAVGMIPLSSVGFQTAYWIWLTATGAFAVAVGALVGRRVGLIMSLMALVTVAGYQTILFGQSAFLMLGLAGVVAWGVVTNKHVVSGASVALMAFKPHLLLGLAVLWLWRRSRFAGSLIAAVVVSIVLFGATELLLPGSFGSWIGYIADSSAGLTGPRSEITLGAAAKLLLGEGPVSTAVVWALVVLGIGWFGSVLQRRRLDDGTVLFAAFGMSIVVSLHALFYDLLLIVPGLILVWGSRRAIRARLVVFGVATLSLLTFGPIAVAAQLTAYGRAIAFGPLALAVYVVWVVESRHGVSPVGDQQPSEIAAASQG